jgi:hypothetical protein
MANPSKRLKVLIVVVVTMLGVVVLTVGLAVAVRAARQAARRHQYSNNLKQVGLALLNFQSVYGRLPPAVHRDEAGKPCCSWRLRMVPFMEGIMREIEYDQRWDAPANQWISTIPWLLFCWLPDENGLHTNVVAITGRGTAFEEGRVVRLEDIAPDTILAIEIAKSDICWAEPGDLDIEHIPESITGGMDGGGVHVAFADGAVWFLRADVPIGELRKFFTIEGAKGYRREQLLRPYAVEGK